MPWDRPAYRGPIPGLLAYLGRSFSAGADENTRRTILLGWNIDYFFPFDKGGKAVKAEEYCENSVFGVMFSAGCGGSTPGQGRKARRLACGKALPGEPFMVCYGEDMGEEKEFLRQVLRRQRSALAEGAEGEARCRCMQGRLMRSAFWGQSRRVLLYVSVRGEADTSLLIRAALDEGRELFLPRCRPDSPGAMDFIRHRAGDVLEPSPFGILEPVFSPESRLLRDDELEEGGTLIVVPALAFDRHGFRLGYGGGYYDRLLAKARCASVGLAFHETLLGSLPREEWDRPVTAVCTEEEMLCL